MQLTEDILREITGCSPEHIESSDDDQRKQNRVPLSIRASAMRIGISGNGRPISIRIREISATGLSFVSAQALLEGEEFVLAVPRQRAKPLLLVCLGVRCQAMDGGIFVVGATFERMLNVSTAAA